MKPVERFLLALATTDLMLLLALAAALWVGLTLATIVAVLEVVAAVVIVAVSGLYLYTIVTLRGNDKPARPEHINEDRK